jgi:hypothetical protein
MVSGELAVTSKQRSSPATPVALFVPGGDAITPPAKDLQVSLAQTGNRSQLYRCVKPKRGALPASQA